MKQYRQTNENYKVADNLRRRLRLAIESNKKHGSAVKDLGCSIDFLKEYLESKFVYGMSWDNYGQWHVDHIYPLSKFNLNNKQEFLMACNYTNLQPLWAKENMSKSNKTGDKECP